MTVDGEKAAPIVLFGFAKFVLHKKTRRAGEWRYLSAGALMEVGGIEPPSECVIRVRLQV